MPFSVRGPLLERDSELAQLATLLAAARGGRGGLALIEGPPGIGKTRLLEAARGAAAQAGMEVLGGRGGDLERDLPFGVVRQLFELRVRRSDPALEEPLLTGPAALARAALMSVEGAGPDEPSAPDPAYAVLHGLYWLTSNLAERSPLVLLIDDVHWSDQPSLRFVHYLARRIQDLPVLLAVTLRTADAEAREELVGRLRAEPGASLLRPAPLSPAAVASVVREQLSPTADRAFCEACHTATRGNPFLVRELIDELRSDGIRPSATEAARVARLVPHAVARQVLARLARLPAEAGDLARAVALLGADAELAVAGRQAELDGTAVPEAADTLVRADLLRRGPRSSSCIRWSARRSWPTSHRPSAAPPTRGRHGSSTRRAPPWTGWPHSSASLRREAGVGPSRCSARRRPTRSPAGRPSRRSRRFAARSRRRSRRRCAPRCSSTWVGPRRWSRVPPPPTASSRPST